MSNIDNTSIATPDSGAYPLARSGVDGGGKSSDRAESPGDERRSQVHIGLSRLTRAHLHDAHDRHANPTRIYRHRRTIMNYMGSKSRVLDTIIAAFPEHLTFLDVFGGSGCLTFAKPPSDIEVYNDLDGEIHNLFRVIRDMPDDLAALIAAAPRSKQLFTELEIQKPDLLGVVGRAFRTLYLSCHGFVCGQKRASHFPACRKTKQRWGTLELAAAIYRWSERFSRITIENLDFSSLIDRYDHSDAFFFFCDSPYPELEFYYRTTFSAKDHARLAERLMSIKGKALLTLPDHPTVHALYDGWTNQRLLKIPYSASGTPRAVKELLIFVNYPPPRTFDRTASGHVA